jgi:hypothetical protein
LFHPGGFKEPELTIIDKIKYPPNPERERGKENTQSAIVNATKEKHCCAN